MLIKINQAIKKAGTAQRKDAWYCYWEEVSATNEIYISLNKIVVHT